MSPFSTDPYIAIEEIRTALDSNDSTIKWQSEVVAATVYALSKDLGKSEKLKWAEIAILIRAHPAERNLANSESQGLSEMLMRLNLMGNFGLILGHKVLDPNSVIEWFKRRQVQSIDEVEKLMSEETPDIDTIRVFREIGHRIRRLQELQSLGYVFSDDLIKWLEIYPRMLNAEKNAIVYVVNSIREERGEV